jgi:aerobic C4-dicarboxylate transport protein
MLLGVDRFMSQCRAVTNLIGNGVATLVVSRWENELDHATLAAELAGGPPGLVMDEPDVQEAERP